MSECQFADKTTSNSSMGSPEIQGSFDKGEQLAPMISNEMRLKMEIVIQITLFTATSIFGIISNTINIAVYWRQGLKDSIMLGLFALSISDFFVVFFPLFTAGCYIADHLFPDSSIHFKAVGGVSTTQIRHLFYSLSCTLTAFLSIERCLCIIKPFKVKLIFTRKRTSIIIAALLLFYVIAFIPILFVQRLRWQTIPQRNFSAILTLWHHPASRFVEIYHNSVMTIFIPTAAQVVVTCTAIFMINGLHKAAKFRQTATGAKNATRVYMVDTNVQTDKPESTNSTAGEGGKDKDELLESRDARLVKTIVLLVTILSIANIPYIALEYTQLTVPEMNPGKRFQNTYRLLSSINFLLGSMNASVNIFVYYCTGSKYRKVFHEILCFKQ